MLVTEEWLRSFVDPALRSEELADRLTMAGLEVESVEPVAPPCSGVVVGHVLGVAPHPNADRLRVCQVDAGTGATLSIVCGAPNVAAGQKVPCALPGAELPGGIRIKPTKMRGVESQGMLCSARELGLGDDHSGLLVLAADATPGGDVRRLLALDDHRFEIKLTPNRGDCLGVVGIAREVAALTGAPLRAPDTSAVAVNSDERLPVRVLAADLCGRFSGRVIRGVNARATTPEWIRRRLERCGQRPISALVDISNYVMLELGRPTHVFDLDRIDGGLEVRWGRPGERVELLNGQQLDIDASVGVIADRHGPEALAGIMGGARTAVSLQTTNIYLEAAFWWPQAIQGRARRFNFATEAGHRFERGVDFATTAAHLEILSRLILEVCGGEATRVGPVDDQVLQLPAREPVRMRFARCRRLLGIDIADDEVESILRRLGMPVARDAVAIVATPPSYRFDLQAEEDLVEEVARVWGFDRIPVHPPLARAAMRGPAEARRDVHELRRLMVAAGFQETINYAFVDPLHEADFGVDAPIRVLNPIASHMAVMRTNLVAGLVDRLRFNLNQRAARVRLFEIGRAFRRDASIADGPLEVAGIAQPQRVAALGYGAAEAEQWGVDGRDIDFFDLKGDLERLLAPRVAAFAPATHPACHPGRCAAVTLDGVAIGWIGELHPRWQQKYELPKAPLLFEIDVEPLLARRIPQAVDVVRFPTVVRDMALWADAALPFGHVHAAIVEMVRSDNRLSSVRDIRLFDVFQPRQEASDARAHEGANALLIKEKSLAFRLVLQDTERTLSDAEADAVRDIIASGLESRLGVRLRR
ncbi:MAG TPA: phenylalanine--tRNA ligase subunit beta [Burkholderiaceae bacterium]|nr:phenylalanine--tRNA ligase subunit beta [Burkholderiaceae bacterium]